MPKLFNLFGYSIFFWANEGDPIEPIHVHVALGAAQPNATKLWITEAGGVVIANNNSHIPMHTLNAIVDVLATHTDDIVSQWKILHGEPRYYC